MAPTDVVYHDSNTQAAIELVSDVLRAQLGLGVFVFYTENDRLALQQTVEYLMNTEDPLRKQQAIVNSERELSPAEAELLGAVLTVMLAIGEVSLADTRVVRLQRKLGIL